MSLEQTTEIIPRLTLSECARLWGKACADIREAFAKLQSVEDELSTHFGGDHYGLRITERHSHRSMDWHRPDEAIAVLQRAVWERIVDRLEIKRLMSVHEWTMLEKQIREGALPDITEDSLAMTLKGMHDRIPEMAAQAVREVFSFLRPMREWRAHKTNSKWRVGKKVILEGYVSMGFGSLGGRFHANYHRDQNLTALNNVFSLLDGKGAVAKTHRGELVDAINASADGTGETTYFRFKCFKNTNLHIEFLRMDLVEELNRVAGGKELRPSV